MLEQLARDCTELHIQFNLSSYLLKKNCHPLPIRRFSPGRPSPIHTLPCVGYNLLFPGRQVQPGTGKGLKILGYWSRLQKGETVSVLPEAVLRAPRKGIKISYITDTGR